MGLDLGLRSASAAQDRRRVGRHDLNRHPGEESADAECNQRNARLRKGKPALPMNISVRTHDCASLFALTPRPAGKRERRYLSPARPEPSRNKKTTPEDEQSQLRETQLK